MGVNDAWKQGNCSEQKRGKAMRKYKSCPVNIGVYCPMHGVIHKVEKEARK